MKIYWLIKSLLDVGRSLLSGSGRLGEEDLRGTHLILNEREALCIIYSNNR